MEPERRFRNSVGIWIGWLISVLAMIIRVDMITTHMVIIVLKAIYRGGVWHLVNILALIILALVNILLAALNIEVLGIITMELILHNPYRYITLMLDPLVNHLSLQDLTYKHIIILIETIYLVSILIARMMIMMILYLLVIQCWNDYISRYLCIILCNLLYDAYILIYFYQRRLYLYFHFIFCVLGDMFWICDTWFLMSTFFTICRDFFSVLCSILRALSKSHPSAAETDPSQCGRDRDFEPRNMYTM